MIQFLPKADACRGEALLPKTGLCIYHVHLVLSVAMIVSLSWLNIGVNSFMLPELIYSIHHTTSPLRIPSPSVFKAPVLLLRQNASRPLRG